MEIVKTGREWKARESRWESISPEPRTEVVKLSRTHTTDICSVILSRVIRSVHSPYAPHTPLEVVLSTTSYHTMKDAVTTPLCFVTFLPHGRQQRDIFRGYTVLTPLYTPHTSIEVML